MHWTENDTKQLIELVKAQKPIQEIAAALHRSPEAIAMKLKRMGLQAEGKSSAKNACNKVTEAATTTRKLEITPGEQLPPLNDATRLLWAALRRLQEPDVGKEELKRLRLIIQGVKSYVHLTSNYLLHVRRVESQMLLYWKHMAARWKLEAEKAQTAEQKTKCEEMLRQAEEEIKWLIEAGVKKPPKVDEEYY